MPHGRILRTQLLKDLPHLRARHQRQHQTTACIYVDACASRFCSTPVRDTRAGTFLSHAIHVPLPRNSRSSTHTAITLFWNSSFSYRSSPYPPRCRATSCRATRREGGLAQRAPAPLRHKRPKQACNGEGRRGRDRRNVEVDHCVRRRQSPIRIFAPLKIKGPLGSGKGHPRERVPIANKRLASVQARLQRLDSLPAVCRKQQMHCGVICANGTRRVRYTAQGRVVRLPTQGRIVVASGHPPSLWHCGGECTRGTAAHFTPGGGNQSRDRRGQPPGVPRTELLAALQVGVDQGADRSCAIREVDVCGFDTLAVEILREARDLRYSPRTCTTSGMQEPRTERRASAGGRNSPRLLNAGSKSPPRHTSRSSAGTAVQLGSFDSTPA